MLVNTHIELSGCHSHSQLLGMYTSPSWGSDADGPCHPLHPGHTGVVAEWAATLPRPGPAAKPSAVVVVAIEAVNGWPLLTRSSPNSSWNSVPSLRLTAPPDSSPLQASHGTLRWQQCSPDHLLQAADQPTASWLTRCCGKIPARSAHDWCWGGTALVTEAGQGGGGIQAVVARWNGSATALYGANLAGKGVNTEWHAPTSPSTTTTDPAPGLHGCELSPVSTASHPVPTMTVVQIQAWSWSSSGYSKGVQGVVVVPGEGQRWAMQLMPASLPQAPLPSTVAWWGGWGGKPERAVWWAWISAFALEYAMRMLVTVNVSLAVLNVLPLPASDGEHIARLVLRLLLRLWLQRRTRAHRVAQRRSRMPLQGPDIEQPDLFNAESHVRRRVLGDGAGAGYAAIPPPADTTASRLARGLILVEDIVWYSSRLNAISLAVMLGLGMWRSL